RARASPSTISLKSSVVSYFHHSPCMSPQYPRPTQHSSLERVIDHKTGLTKTETATIETATMETAAMETAATRLFEWCWERCPVRYPGSPRLGAERARVGRAGPGLVVPLRCCAPINDRERKKRSTDTAKGEWAAGGVSRGSRDRQAPPAGNSCRCAVGGSRS